MLCMFSKFHTYTFGEFFEICFEYSFRKNIYPCMDCMLILSRAMKRYVFVWRPPVKHGHDVKGNNDIRFVKTLEFDVLQIQGETRGYIEGRAKDVKQSNRKKKQTLFMPLVAPVRGVHPNIVWGTAWQSVSQQVGRNFTQDPVGPLLPAIGPDGRWLRRTVDSAEASDWLTKLLQKREPSLARVTTHSLKHTTLGWLSKFGIYGETQTLLAHHSTGALSTLAYSRDALSGPLRKLETVLSQVRTGAFCPDSTRSGYWKSAPGPDGAESSLGSWDCVAKEARDFVRDVPVLPCPDEGRPQDRAVYSRE